MRRWVGVVVCALAGMGTLASCSDDGSSDASSDDSEESDGSGCGAGEAAIKKVEKCLSASLAYVTSKGSSGSGVLLDNGFLLTNAHVVDPFTEAAVVFDDGDVLETVPVKGVDLQADLALLGPIEGDHPGVALDDSSDLEKADPLFLLGYPDDFAPGEKPELTVESGFLSRRRHDERFGLDFLQSDTHRDSDQSGAVLADSSGRVVGVGGYQSDQLALAISGSSAAAAVERIAAGDGDPYGELDTMATATTGDFEVGGDLDTQAFVVPAGPARTLHLEVTPAAEALVEVEDFLGEPIFVEDRFEAYLEGQVGLGELGFDPAVVGPATAPGVYDVELPPDVDAVVNVASTVPTGKFTFSSSEPLGVAARGDQSTIEVGESRDGLIGYFESRDSYTVDLEAGQSIDIFAGSSVGDIAYRVLPPPGVLAEPVEVDDSGEGLFGLDAHDVFVVPAPGRYTISVFSNMPVASVYRLEVRDADADEGDPSDGADASDSTSAAAGGEDRAPATL